MEKPVVDIPGGAVQQALLLGFEGCVGTLHVIVEPGWEVDERAALTKISLSSPWCKS
jgi:hypothetical protein